jgi:Leucine-rich repeat (LRR) protein
MSERGILWYFYRDKENKYLGNTYYQLSDYHLEALSITEYHSIRLNKYTYESMAEFFLKLTHWRGIEIFGYKGKGLPPLPLFPNLEFLSLIDCVQLQELPQTLNNLPVFKYFFLVHSNIASIESFLEKQVSLQKLTLEILPKLEKLPDCFDKLINLQSVTLKNLNIEQLPASLGKMENLEELEITHCHKLSQLPDFSGLKNLKKVKLDFNKSLLSFPESLTQLSNLEELYIQLSEGAIFDIPSSFGNLKKLRELTIFTHESSCKVTLPPEIGQLTSLQECCIRHVNFNQLPESFSNCTALEKLIIGETQLEKLPENIGNLTNIVSLILVKNHLTTFPESIGKLKKLSSLEAYGNPLTKLPESICECVELETLEIGSNNQANKQVCLSALPEKLGNLRKLKILSLRGTFSSFPASMSQITNLERFNLEGSENITLFPDFLLQCSNISSINIAETGITQIPTALYTLAHLYWLNTENTPLQCAPRKADYYFLQLFTLRDESKVLDDETKRLCYFVFFRNYLQETFENFSLSLLFEALKLNHEPLKNALLEDVKFFNTGQKSLKEKPLQKGDVVSIVGNISYKKNEIKDKLKQLEIGYSANFSEKTTHLLVGNSPKSDFFTKNIPFLFNEKELTDYLNQIETPYLLSTESSVGDSIENIRSLIYSTEDTNELLAVTMLEGIGLPEELETEIFTVTKISKQEEVRTKSRRLLQKFSKNTSLLNALSYRSLLIPHYRGGKWSKKGSQSENRKVNYSLEHYHTKFPELDMATVSYLIGKKLGYDVSYFFMLTSKEDDSRRREFVEQQKANTSLYLTLNPPFTKTELEEILEEAVQKAPNLITLSLNLERCKGLPENILKLAQLSTLVLNNFSFEMLPSSITQLKQLQKLELRQYDTTLTFPDNIGELNNLTSLLLRVKEITNLDLVRTQLPNCTISY